MRRMTALLIAATFAAASNAYAGDDPPQLDRPAQIATLNRFRACWVIKPGDEAFTGMSVILSVNTDLLGIPRRATVATFDRHNLINPIYRAFAERVERSILSPPCQKPVSSDQVPVPRDFTFLFVL